jgi:hypothetical protein
MLSLLLRRRAVTRVDYGLLTAGVLFFLLATIAIVGSQTNLFLQRAAEGTGEETTPPASARLPLLDRPDHGL